MKNDADLVTQDILDEPSARGRKSAPAAESREVTLNEAAVRADFDLVNDLGAQQQARVVAVAQRLGYQLGSTDPDLIQRDIAANMRRSVESCLEVGRGLVVLKELCEHGQFMLRLDVLSLEPSVAQRFMQAAMKFSKAATSQLLKAAGNQSKLFEMLVLDDEQIEELELTGQTGELALDDVATMSVKELRAAVRKERAVARRMEDVNKELNTELALKKNLKIAATDWPERFGGLMDQADLAERTLMKMIGALEAVRASAMADEPQHPDEEAPLARARAALADKMVATYGRVAEFLDVSGLLFDKTLGAFAAEVRK